VENKYRKAISTHKFRNGLPKSTKSKHLVKMCEATRAFVVQWARHETEPRNLQYIVSRLAVWENAKHQTLADLEKELFRRPGEKRAR
jgi:hypothetical protein